MDTAVACRSLDHAPSTTPDRKRTLESKLLLLELAERLGSVSRACRIMDYSRDSFYRFRKLYANGGERALQVVSRRKPILKNRVVAEVEAAVLKLSVERPTWGQARIASALAERGVSISPAGVRCVWIRSQLQTIPLRLKAIEKSSSREESAGS
jgi:winged helix-turn helix protein